ncbi:TlpA family protein disulfide reductase [Kribbia dieselivorans]|uniref:TlpA family protein disulfide reductase n=1 Tax=Kribbia dieselivorans TaxID=331526 RepID=UPI000838353C|nr:TlpA disulfide reductase family protein [Kribbia dieselivorans]
MSLRRRLPATLAALTLLVGGAAACSSDNNSVANQAKAGDNKNFIQGDGTIEQIPSANRAEPITLSGTTLEGKPLDLADYRGKTVVINIWGSWCAPCQKEAPALKEVHENADPAKVAFVGIDSRESAASGLAQQKAWDHTFPSLSDEGGTAPLSLQNKATATPSTLVLDTQGRIAAVFRGPIERSTLEGMIEDAQKA